MSIARPIDRNRGVPDQHGRGRRLVSRRTVLGAAIAGGAGVGAVRLLGLDRIPLPSATRAKSATGTDWVSPLGSHQGRIAHLLRRATFGATQGQLEEAFSAGYSKTVDRLLETKPAQPPDFLSGDVTKGARLDIGKLQQWWVDHILTTPTPFAERMALFWHGHFTSDFRKVGAQTPFMYWQNLTWRNFALSDLHSILMQVTIDPAMLRYLDLATSTASAPNENYSRELMELFTMGTGNFAEDDVRSGAKALSGWMLPKPTGSIDLVVDPKNNIQQRYAVYDAPAPGYLDPKRAYTGTLTFLGKTGKFDTQAVIDSILTKPATATFITKRVMSYFVSAQPAPAFVTRVAGKFRASKYDVKTLMREIFTAPEFFADQSYRSLVKSPIEYMVHAIRALNAPQLSRMVVQSGPGMGQALFDPPDVGGWPNNEAWVSSNNVVARINFTSALLAGLKSGLPSADRAYQVHLDGVLAPQTASLLNQATDDRTRWFLVLASPEFQLK